MERHGAHPLSQSLQLPIKSRALPVDGQKRDQILPQSLEVSWHAPEHGKAPRHARNSSLQSSKVLFHGGDAHGDPAHASGSSTPLTAAGSDSLSSSALFNNPDSLESHFQSLGHTGFLRHQRDAFKYQLASEKLSAAKYRGLSFRLAARVAASEAKLGKKEKMIAQQMLADYMAGRKSKDMLDKLRSTVKTYEKQGSGLLKMLSGFGLDGAEETSPPLSPREEALEWTPVDAQHLPTEILEFCKFRVEALLRECRLSRDTLELLRETERNLKAEADEHERKIHELQSQKAASDAELQSLNDKLSSVLQELQDSRQKVKSAEASLSSLQAVIEQRDSQIRDMDTQTNTLNLNLASMEADLQLAKQDLDQARVKSQLLLTSKQGIEEVVKMHETRNQQNQSTIRQGQADLAMARDQLDKLEHESSETSARIAELEKVLSAKQLAMDEQTQIARDEQDSSNEKLEQFMQDLSVAKSQIKEAERSIQIEQEKQAQLKQTEQALRVTVADQEQSHLKLEEANAKLLEELESTKSVQNEFIASANRLNEELEGEKAKTVALIETESELKEQLTEYKEVETRLQERIKKLEVDILARTGEAEESSTARKELEQELEEVNSVLEEAQKAHKEQISAIVISKQGVDKELKCSREEVEKLRQQLEESNREYTSLKEELSTLRHSFNQTREQAHQNKAAYEAELHEYRTRVSSQDAQIRGFQTAVSQGKQQIGNLQKKTSFLERKCKNTQDVVDEMLEQKTQVDAELLSLKTKIAQKEAVNKSLSMAIKSGRAKFDAVKTARRNLLRKTLEQEANKHILNKQISRLDLQVKSLNNQLSDADGRRDALSSEIDSLREQIVLKESASVDQDQQIRQLKKDHEKVVRELTGQIDTLKLERDEQIQLFKSEQAAYSELKVRQEEATRGIGSEREDWKRDMLEKQKQIADLKESITSQRGHINSLRGKLAVKTGEIDALEEEIGKHKSRQKRLSQVLEDNESEMHKLRSQLDEHSAKATQLNDELHSLRRSSGQQVERIPQLESQIQKLQDDNAELKKNKSMVEGWNHSLTKENIRLGEVIGRRDDAMSQFHTQFRVLQKRATEADRKVTELEKLIEERDQDAENLRNQAESHAYKIHELEAQLQAHEKHRSRWGIRSMSSQTHVPNGSGFFSQGSPSTPVSAIDFASQDARRLTTGYRHASQPLLATSGSGQSPSPPRSSPDAEDVAESPASAYTSPHDSVLSGSSPQHKRSKSHGASFLSSLRPQTPTRKVGRNLRTVSSGGALEGHLTIDDIIARPNTAGAPFPKLEGRGHRRNTTMESAPSILEQPSGAEGSVPYLESPAPSTNTHSPSNSQGNAKLGSPISLKTASIASNGTVPASPRTPATPARSSIGRSSTARSSTIGESGTVASSEVERRDSRRWGEKHPKLWKLVHMGRDRQSIRSSTGSLVLVDGQHEQAQKRLTSEDKEMQVENTVDANVNRDKVHKPRVDSKSIHKDKHRRAGGKAIDWYAL